MIRKAGIILGLILFIFGSGTILWYRNNKLESLKSPVPQGGSKGAPKKNISQIINFNNWKLTLPTGNSKKPKEILQPELSKFTIDPWFVFDNKENGFRFRAPVTGVTTGGSKYPRSELREMSGNSKASWSSTDGVHSMTLDQKITSVPKTKKHVVAGQIHDAEDDVIVIRLEYPKLYVNVDGKNAYLLNSNYKLGERFNVKLEVANGKTKVYYNGNKSPVYILNKNYSGAYFKAGAYTQSNCSKESFILCSDRNYGEVILYKAAINHSS